MLICGLSARDSHYVNQERLLQDSDDIQAQTAADLEMVPIRDDMGFGGVSSFSDAKGLILTHLCKVPGLVLPKFSSVWFSPHFLRTENRTDRFFSELNRTGSNRQTARNFEKCALHKFYTLKLIAASDLCLNFFVLMLFEGTS